MRRPDDLIDAFQPAKGPPPRRLAAFLAWCLSGAWPILLLAVLTSVGTGVAEIVAAMLLGRVIDLAGAAGPASLFTDHWLALAAMAGFFLVLRPLLFGLSAATTSLILQPNLTPLVLSRLHRWTLGQAVSFFDDDFAGRIAQKQMQTARAVTEVTTEIVNVVAYALASLLGAGLLLSAINGWIALVLAGWLCLYFALIRYFLPRVRSRAGHRAAARATVSGQVVDTVTNIKTVKLFAHDRHEDEAALGAMEVFREAALSFGRMATAFRFGLMAVAGLLPVLLVGGTLLLWTQGTASVGDIAAAGAVALRIAQMTGWVSFALMGIYSNVGEIEDGIETLAAPHGLPDRPGARALDHARGEIAFHGVDFAYGREGGGIAGIDLTIRPGEKLGIVGASGAGKSTLVALLLRLYDCEKGRITIDGQDIRDLTQDSLRRQIAMVTQETAMFNRSARENILYGDPSADETRLVEAARRAEADGFIRGLQDHKGRSGYDAHLGERGVKLSGGQRQRIALARAFLKDAPILVLDEATSALDSEVEATIQAALHRAMEGKTVLAIAHRLSTLSQMDRIIVMDAGRIVEDGTHDDLLRRDGLYARYWHRQSGGFIGSGDAD